MEAGSRGMACSAQGARMQPNWFVGLKVPVGPWHEARVTSPPEGYRRFVGEDLHLTVAFLGPVDEAAALAAWALHGAWREGAIPASFGALVAMGNPRRHSALSALLDRGWDEACALIEALRAPMLEAAGSRPDDRLPKPHVTFARPRQRATREERQAGIEWAAGIALQDVECVFEELCLYTWSHDRQRSLFRVAASARLADAAG